MRIGWISGCAAVCAIVACTSAPGLPEPAPLVRISDRQVGDDSRKRYFLFTAENSVGPAGLLVALPGGTGEASFVDFFDDMYREAIPHGYLLAQLVAPRWSQDQRIVWPTATVTTAGMRFNTPEFIESVIRDVTASYSVDRSRIFVLGWSSSGPASYAAALTNSEIKGAFISASIFRPAHFPPLEGARGKRFYLVTSDNDTLVPASDVEFAANELRAAGAEVTLDIEQGSHNAWVATTFKPLRSGIQWLESGND